LEAGAKPSYFHAVHKIPYISGKINPINADLRTRVLNLRFNVLFPTEGLIYKIVNKPEFVCYDYSIDESSAKIDKIMIIKFLRRNYAYFGLAGVGVVCFCSLVTALFYTGSSGEPYSLIDHFISELGEVGVSPLAWLFNLGLVAGGLLFIVFILGLGLSLPGWLAKAGMVAGVGAGLALVGVGLFPMNHLPSHLTAAMTYFRLGLVTIVLFGLAIQLQPKGRVVIDKRANLASLLAATFYASFVLFSSLIPIPGGTEAVYQALHSNRSKVWPLAVMEWLVFFLTILWFAVVALAGRKTRKTIGISLGTG
jgi:hypothetical membrane protein